MNEQELAIDEFPFVIFDETTEEVRRKALTGHTQWEPQGLVLEALREHVDVGGMAMRRKKLYGSRSTGFRSEPAGAGGLRTLTYSRNWTIELAADRLRVEIIDSLSSASELFGDVEEAIVYEFTQITPRGDLLGTYREGHKNGTARLIRCKQRRVVK